MEELISFFIVTFLFNYFIYLFITYFFVYFCMQNGASATDQKVLCCWCCASDPIIASMTVARQGYVPGEAIVFNSEIDNKSDREMTCSKARLIMVSPFVRNLALLFLMRRIR